MPDTSNAAPELLHEDPARSANLAKKKVLGRGLSVLMRGSVSASPIALPPEPAKQETVPPLTAPPEDGLFSLPMSRVIPSESQPRKAFSESELSSLAQSIRESGVLQPILVRRKKVSGEEQLYEIVAGERRFRAAKMAGLTSVPALLRDIGDREALEIGIVENVQRADLSPIEEASAYRRLVDEFSLSHNEIAKAVGKDRTSIVNSLRLLKLPELVRAMLDNGKLSAGHGRALLMFESVSKQLSIAKKAIEEGLSVRAVEQLAGQHANSGSVDDGAAARNRLPKLPSVMELEERLRRALGTKVALSLNHAGKGALRISFFSRLELEQLLDKLGA